MAKMRLAALWDDPLRAIGVLVLGGYVGIAFAFENAYPFSVFDMYARPRTTASRIVARDGRGGAAEVERFDGWRCPEPLDTSPARCAAEGPFFQVAYIDASREAYIVGHAGEGGERENVDVVRRIWRLEGDGPPRMTDCLLEQCTAVRR
jgi:hypothetical protein